MQDIINLLSMTNDQVKEYNMPLYDEMRKDGHYYNVLFEEKKRLESIVNNFENNIDFYNYVALEFTNRYIDLMASEYKDKIDDIKISKLNKLKTNEGVKILKPKEAIELGLIKLRKDGKTAGSESAFANGGTIYFTPGFEDYRIDFSSLSKEQKNNIIVSNALRMMGTMIHETFHLLIDVRDPNEKIEWYENGVLSSSRGSAGFIMNEAIVEKYATDFAKKYKLPQNPALFYLHYVKFYEELVKINPNHDVFKEDYNKILFSTLNNDEINLYKYNERVKSLEKNHNIKNVEIIINDTIQSNIVK